MPRFDLMGGYVEGSLHFTLVIGTSVLRECMMCQLRGQESPAGQNIRVGPRSL